MALFSREPVLGGEECDQRLGIQGRWPNIRVTYGDHEIKGIRSLTLDLSANEMPELILRISPWEIEIDTETMITLEAHVRPKKTEVHTGISVATLREPLHESGCDRNMEENDELAARLACTCDPDPF